MDFVGIIIDLIVQFAPLILVIIICCNIVKSGLQWLKDFIKN